MYKYSNKRQHKEQSNSVQLENQNDDALCLQEKNFVVRYIQSSEWITFLYVVVKIKDL